MSIATQFYLLQYKSWKLQFRKKLVTLFEFLIPVLLCLLMVMIRSVVVVTDYPEPTYFPSFPIDLLPSGLVNPLTMTAALAYTPKTPLTDIIMAGVKSSLQPQLTTPPFVLGNLSFCNLMLACFYFCVCCLFHITLLSFWYKFLSSV